MSLSVELSGVQTAQTDIDTIGNNIANVATTGFKGSTAQFGDLYAASVGGAASNGAVPGQGASTTSLAQLFAEGTINQTGNPLDVAVNGNGFFQVQNAGGVSYTRDGSFQVDANGFLITNTGAQIMGFAPTATGAGATSGPLGTIQINTANIAPAATANLTMAVNLPSGDAPIDTTATPFSIANPNSYNESTTTSVYDSLGVSRSLTTYFTQVAGSGAPDQWQTNWELTNSNGSFVASGAGPTMTFNSSGLLLSGSGTISATDLSDGAADLSITQDFTGSSLSNLAFGVSAITDDGTGGGQFTGVQIAANGDITGQYSNGASKVFGTIALANFANPQGLIPISNNQWLASVTSGSPTTGVAGTAGLGALEGGALEGSNVDLSSELVNLISAQQAYQANVQGINVEQQDVQRLLTIQ